jgi:hypothetical protein
VNQKTRNDLTDYIEARRTPQTGGHGREPLFTNPNGRMSRPNAYKHYTTMARRTSDWCGIEATVDGVEGVNPFGFESQFEIP